MVMIQLFLTSFPTKNLSLIQVSTSTLCSSVTQCRGVGERLPDPQGVWNNHSQQWSSCRPGEQAVQEPRLPPVRVRGRLEVGWEVGEQPLALLHGRVLSQLLNASRSCGYEQAPCYTRRRRKTRRELTLRPSSCCTPTLD